jgi:pimeloyl-ACP methyl ester carboxylesterase
MKAAGVGFVLLAVLCQACSVQRSGMHAESTQLAGALTEVVSGAGFQHRLHINRQAIENGEAPVLVFIEGDGTPWTHGGRRAASDPTSRHPLALQLFSATGHPAWYISRPCYDGLRSAGCTPELWTSGRYSEGVVTSLAAALNTQLHRDHNRKAILIGHSGGGALAVLLARRVNNTLGIISIGANLDTAAWTGRHGYLPLTGSLNPADQPVLQGVIHVLLSGLRDRNVPLATVSRYLERNPATIVTTYPRFDHGCCWTREWQIILPAALAHIRTVAD